MGMLTMSSARDAVDHLLKLPWLPISTLQATMGHISIVQADLRASVDTLRGQPVARLFA